MDDQSSLPQFTEDGILPPGDYQLTLEELIKSHLVSGEASENRGGTWDREWPLRLVLNLSLLCRQLWHVGISEIFVNGSFVEDRDHPNDINGYFVCSFDWLASGQLERDLNVIDPFKVWTWDPASRRPYTDYPKRQLPMWHAYRVELYLSLRTTIGDTGQVRT